MTNNNYIDLVIGIDPSLCETGIIGLRGGKVEFSHLVKSKKTGDTPLAELDRLRDITNEIEFILDKYKPKLVMIESLAFMARNTTALAQLCGLNYFIRNVAYKSYTTYMVTPTGLKKFIASKGNCQKDLMMLETYKKYKISFTNNNSCDAHALARVGEAILNPDLKLNQQQQEVVAVIKKQYEKNN